MCLIEDTQKYGEPYWHRMHQIPGVLVCPTHGFVLLDSSIAVEAIRKKSLRLDFDGLPNANS